MDLKLSCPAVSHICSLICLPSREIILAPNSTPMVKSWTGWKRLSVNWRRRHDFPTPGGCWWDESALRESSKAENCRDLVSILICLPSFSHLVGSPQARSRHIPQVIDKIIDAHYRHTGSELTCVSNDDVLEEVTVAHFCFKAG